MNALDATLDEAVILRFRVRRAAERAADPNAEIAAAPIGQIAGVIECHTRGCDGKLRKPLGAL